MGFDKTNQFGLGLMAHLQQRMFFERIKKQYPDHFENVDVLDIGSLDINGSVRDMFNGGTYLGVDVGPGQGVDIIAFGQDLTYPDRSFDVCLSAECMEHNPEWIATFANMVRMSRSMVIMTCATTGRPEHGTARSHPGSSPLTVPLWDYYRNLTDTDFREAFDLDSMFQQYWFEVNTSSSDLYFLGFVPSLEASAVA